MKHFVYIFLVLVLWSCANKTNEDSNHNFLKEGYYLAEIDVKDNKRLPFNFKVINKDSLEIYNAEEVILVDEITYSKDSVFIKTPVFEGYIAAKFSDSLLTGKFIKKGLNREVPFKATYGVKERYNIINMSNTNISGNWETVFSKGVEDDEYIAKGIFKQDGSKVTGTFRTTTGDYRFLEGVLDGNELKLSTFDGAHAFLFTATVTDSTMNGYFYSGDHWKEPFEAVLNNAYELPDSNTLTYLKEGYDTLDFVFPNSSDELIGIKDDRFNNKVTVVQVMGTWCPNCLDESKYFSEYYKNNKDKDIAFVALAFEYAKTKELAFSRMDRLQHKLGIEYPILLAQFGTTNKTKAQEKLPMLNHILSYPTTIVLDKKGKVRHVHTGFNGPATGEKYTEFKLEFEGLIENLLAEN